MVTAVTSFGRSGLADWLIQRVSAVVLAAYVIFITGFIVATPDMTFETWSALFDSLCMRVFSLVTLISIIAHAWIGLWSVVTDYVTNRLMGGKATALRLLALALIAIVSVTYLVWGIEILWGF